MRLIGEYKSSSEGYVKTLYPIEYKDKESYLKDLFEQIKIAKLNEYSYFMFAGHEFDVWDVSHYSDIDNSSRLPKIYTIDEWFNMELK